MRIEPDSSSRPMSALASRVTLGAVMVATLGTAQLAGVALTYAIAVMPGLASTDDQTFVEAFQVIDAALDRATWFWVAVFVGTMTLIVLSATVALRHRHRAVLGWLVLAAILYGAAMAITGVGLDPLEQGFGRFGQTRPVGDASALRTDLDEDRWALLNILRLVTAMAAAASLTWALVLLGARRHAAPIKSGPAGLRPPIGRT